MHINQNSNIFTKTQENPHKNRERRPRVYVPSSSYFLEVARAVALSDSQAHHLLNVLRLGQGSQVILFNESGEWLGDLDLRQKTPGVIITRLLRSPEPNQSPIKRLFFAPIKGLSSGAIVEKATELMMTEIQPIITERTVIRQCTTEKLQQASIAATEQCGRLVPPGIRPAISLPTHLQHCGQEHQQPSISVIFDPIGNHCRYYDAGNSAKQDRPPQLTFSTDCLAWLSTQRDVGYNGYNPSHNLSYNFYIGPEGGWSDGERAGFIATAAKLQPSSLMTVMGLGSTIMRAETALIALMGVMLLLGSDLNAQSNEWSK